MTKKSIIVDIDTWKDLNNIKINDRFKTIDGVIKYLLENKKNMERLGFAS